MKPALLQILFIIGLTWLLSTSSAWGKAKLSAKTTPTQERKDFKQCRSEALQLHKSGQLNATELKEWLASCRDQFPGIDAYLQCKKQLLSQKSSKTKSKKHLKRRLKRCRKIMTASRFQPDDPIPMAIQKKKILFAGIGINAALPVKQSSKLANLRCAPLAQATQHPEKAEFVLFGNHPRRFKPIKQLSQQKIRETLKLPAKLNPSGHFIQELGMLYGGLGKSSTLYFPAAGCLYAADTGPFFRSISIYYLVDEIQQMATPYFGVAFYNNEETETLPTTRELVDEISARLAASKLGAVSAQKSEHSLHILSHEKITEFDDEGDPKNLCGTSPKPSLVIVVRGSPDEPDRPDYLLVANAKNLCDYGDRRLAQFL